MRTTIFARVIALVGLVTIVLGAWNVIIETPRFPLIDFSIAVGIVAGGFGLIGLAQVMRLGRGIQNASKPCSMMSAPPE